MSLVSEEIAHQVKEEKRIADDVAACQAARLLRKAESPLQTKPLNILRRALELTGNDFQTATDTDRNRNVHRPYMVLNEKLLKGSAQRNEKNGSLALLDLGENLVEHFRI